MFDAWYGNGRVMWLEATLTQEDLTSFFERLLPLEIRLGDGGRLLLLGGPVAVSLVPDRGVEVVCEAKLHWPILGIRVPVAIHAAASSIQPSVELRPQGHTLVFRLEVDRTALTGLHSVDEHVAARVNEELQAKQAELAWTFSKTLNHVFAMPEALLSTEALSLETKLGVTKVTERALTLAVRLDVGVQRREPLSEPASPASGDDEDNDLNAGSRASAGGASERRRR
jgi:hypothetical protein